MTHPANQRQRPSVPPVQCAHHELHGIRIQVSRSECKEGATGIVGGANWAPIVALVSLLVLVVVVQYLLHYICPVSLLAAICGDYSR